MKHFLTQDLKTAVREWLIHNMSCTVKQIANFVGHSTNYIYKLADTENEGEHYCHLNIHQLLMITKCSGDFRLLDYIEDACGRVAHKKVEAAFLPSEIAILHVNLSVSRLNEGIISMATSGITRERAAIMLGDIEDARKSLARLEDCLHRKIDEIGGTVGKAGVVPAED